MRYSSFLWFLGLSCLILFSCKAKQAAVNVSPEKTGTDANVPVLEWDKKMVDLGKIKKGDVREMAFTFTNTSNVPAKWELATPCHCTSLKQPAVNTVFEKGESGTIYASFDSSEKEKSEQIDITIILANTDSKGYPVIDELFFKYEF